MVYLISRFHILVLLDYTKVAITLLMEKDIYIYTYIYIYLYPVFEDFHAWHMMQIKQSIGLSEFNKKHNPYLRYMTCVIYMARLLAMEASYTIHENDY